MAKKNLKFENYKPQRAFTTEEIQTYFRYLKGLREIEEIVGASQKSGCGPFLEAFTRYALGYRKPDKGDAMNPDSGLVEIKSSTYVGEDPEKPAVFSAKESEEDRLAEIIVTRVDDEFKYIKIYNTGLDSAGLRNLQATKCLLVSEKQAKGERSYIKFMRDFIIPNHIPPCKIYDIEAGAFIL